MDAATLIFCTLCLLSASDLGHLTYALWRLWKQYNNCIWNNVVDGVSVVYDCASALHEGWSVAQKTQQHLQQPQTTPTVMHWTTPSHRQLKCNIDDLSLYRTMRWVLV